MAAERYYTAADCRELERLSGTECGIEAFTLMQRAGAAAFDALLRRWPNTTSIEIFCGTGNNGGDGFILATVALGAGLRPLIHIVGDASRISGEALKALQRARNNQVPISSGGSPSPDLPDTVVVDALLGTGLSGEVRSPVREAIAAINNSGLPVLALDLPSGLCSDTGKVLGCCVQADLTVTFIGRKPGLIGGDGPRVCGTVVLASLDLPETLYRLVSGAPA